jgi:malate dehydrogenase (oxaloacetate-decarboxylating)
MKGMDMVVALSRSGPGVVLPEWVSTMADDAIVFACANPVPEIWPWEAKEAGAAVIATGRSDFPNQVNNSLGFPGIFRGTLDIRAKTITDPMCTAAALALAGMAEEKGLTPDYILPNMDEWEVFPREAAAVAMKAIDEGVAGKKLTYDEELKNAGEIIRRSRNLTQTMMADGFIAEA